MYQHHNRFLKQPINMKTTAFVLLAAASAVGAFRLPATPSPRLAPMLKASSLLQQQQRSATTLAWGVRGGGALKAATASDETSLKNWDPQQWIAPAFHNRGSVRLLAVLAGIGAVMHRTGTPVPRKIAAFVHLLSFGANLGAQLYTTFVLGIVMIKMLPRQMFGKLQVCTHVGHGHLLHLLGDRPLIIRYTHPTPTPKTIE